MASVGHIAIGLAAGRLHARRGAGPRALAGAMAFFSVLSLLPDADVVAFARDIPYHAPFGHRGASHSLSAAALLGAVVGFCARLGGRPGPARLGLLAGAVVATHGILDAFTDGGLGVALLWPLTDARYFAPWRPIPVAPIGLDFISAWGLEVAATEAAMFAPVAVWAAWPRRAGAARPAGR